MSYHEANERAMQVQVVDTLVKELQAELPRMMKDLRTQAAKAATRSIRATAFQPRQGPGTYAEACMAQERDAEADRMKALELEGRADGIHRISNGMFGAMGVKSNDVVIEEYLRNLHRYIEQRSKDVSDEIEAAARDAIQYSPAHPNYGVARAKAIKLDAVTDGMLEVMSVAQRMAANILTTMSAAAVLR